VEAAGIEPAKRSRRGTRTVRGVFKSRMGLSAVSRMPRDCGVFVSLQRFSRKRLRVIRDAVSVCARGVLSGCCPRESGRNGHLGKRRETLWRRAGPGCVAAPSAFGSLPARQLCSPAGPSTLRSFWQVGHILGRRGGSSSRKQKARVSRPSVYGRYWARTIHARAGARSLQPRTHLAQPCTGRLGHLRCFGQLISE
jgi:hypothetical protein